MTNPNGKVQLDTKVRFARQGGGASVVPMESPDGLFIWFSDPETKDVLGMWGRDINSADDVKRHIAESRAKWARMG